MASLREKIRTTAKKILASNSTPHEVAFGFAIGIFVAFLPVVPLQTVLLAALMLLFRRSNKLAAFAASWVMNHFTLVPIYLGLFWLGDLVCETGATVSAETFDELDLDALAELGLQILVPLGLGGLFVSCVGAVVTYVVTKRLVKRRRQSVASAPPAGT